MARPASTVICWPVIEVFLAAEIYASAQSSRKVCHVSASEYMLGNAAHLVLEWSSFLNCLDSFLAVLQALDE